MSEMLLITKASSIRRSDLDEWAKNWKKFIPENEVIGVHSHDPLLITAVILLALQNQRALVLFRSSFEEPLVNDFVKKLGIRLIFKGTLSDTKTLSHGSTASKYTTSKIGIFTSGTTGTPKLAWHTWENIQAASNLVPDRLHGKRWLLTYSPTSYAGLQVLFSAINSSGSVVFGGDNLWEHPDAIIRDNVNIISATPTYWRMLANNWPAPIPKPHILQATLGGEPVRQDVIDLVREKFLPEQITHIYASTEAGSAIIVSDGKEGFPIEYLERKGPIQIRIYNGRLEIRSSKGMSNYSEFKTNVPNEWFQTPDRVEINCGRAYFIGRDDGIINIGGTKIMPEEVEAALVSIDGIIEAHVFGRKNPITGMLLCADLVMSPGVDLDPEALKATLRDKLPSTHIPRILKQVDQLRISENGKKLRTN